MDYSLIKRNHVLFFLACLGLGVLAELSFLHGDIGVSYLVFISGFYLVLFIRYRLNFNHRRIGILLMVVIWLLSGSFLLYDNAFFNSLNQLVIPILVFSHIVLITQPNTFKWETPHFIYILLSKFQQGWAYSFQFIRALIFRLFGRSNKQTYRYIQQVLIGLCIGFPLLIIVLILLMSADIHFEEFVAASFLSFINLNIIEYSFRFIFIILVGCMFFGVFQMLSKQNERDQTGRLEKQQKFQWDHVIVMTVLLLLNSVYVLFVSIQFKYFFSAELLADLTYAEYARQGFYELIFVTVINWVILFSVLGRLKQRTGAIVYSVNGLLSLLVIASGVMLISAFRRLSLYEAAYGFTVDRFLAYAFMIFLTVIFLYTFIRIWLERLSLIHFYLIVGLIFYTILNIMNVDQYIVDKNLERYERTGKIDIDYLAMLSDTGRSGLVTLYSRDPNYPELAETLLYYKDWVQDRDMSWQAYNFTRETFKRDIEALDVSQVKSQSEEDD